MREFIGNCADCGKDLYCLDGFFYGILTKENNILCFDCHENREKNPQS